MTFGLIRTCDAMHRERPFLECERVAGHIGPHAALLDEEQQAVQWSDAECVHPRIAERMRKLFDVGAQVLLMAGWLSVR